MITCRSALIPVSTWTRPEGQRIVNLSTRVSPASPRWTWLGDCEKYALAGNSSRTILRPLTSAVSRAPMPWRLLVEPRSVTVRWCAGGSRFS
jgi:hypothetical protein